MVWTQWIFDNSVAEKAGGVKPLNLRNGMENVEVEKRSILTVRDDEKY